MIILSVFFFTAIQIINFLYANKSNATTVYREIHETVGRLQELHYFELR